MSWFVYIIRNQHGRLYTGITNDLDRRLQEHNGLSSKGAKATRAGRPWVYVYTEPCLTKIGALRREYEIKTLRKPQKLIILQAHG